MSNAFVVGLNAMPDADAYHHLKKCCGADWWCQRMLAERPLADLPALHLAADRVFDDMPKPAWLEAFASHPPIGDLESLKMKFAGNRQWSGAEQAGVSLADDATLLQLREANQAYLKRFGYIFIVCATGKTAAQMLELLQRRLGNDEDTEFREAAGQQRAITHLRLDKLASEFDSPPQDQP